MEEKKILNENEVSQAQGGSGDHLQIIKMGYVGISELDPNNNSAQGGALLGEAGFTDAVAFAPSGIVTEMKTVE